MRRALTGLAVLGLFALVAVPAQARKHHRSKASGIDGVVLDSSCYGACRYPPPPEPAYTGGGLTVTVTRAADGVVIVSSHPSDGHFRFRLKRGLYRVGASIVQPAPVSQASSKPTNCWQGSSQETRVRRHRFTHVELDVRNVCIV